MLKEIPNIKLKNEYWNSRFKEGAIYGEKPSKVMEIILPYLKNSKNSLVVGGGYGRNAMFLADHDIETKCIDISKNAINLGKNLYGNKPNLHFKNISIHDVSEYEFDSVVSIYLLSLLDSEELDRLLEKIKKLLNIKGKFICNFLSTDDEEFGLGKKIDENTYLLDHGKQLVKFYSKEEVERLLQQHGFKITNLLKTEEIRFIDVLNKKITTRSWLVICEKNNCNKES